MTPWVVESPTMTTTRWAEAVDARTSARTATPNRIMPLGSYVRAAASVNRKGKCSYTSEGKSRAAQVLCGREEAACEARVRGPAERRVAARHGAQATQGFDPAERFGDPRRIDPSALDRVRDPAHRVPGRIDGLADEQHVAPRDEGLDGPLSRGRACGDRVHLEVVAEEHAAEAEPSAEEVVEDRAGERRRAARVERGIDDVRRHEGGEARRDRARERCEVDRPERAS